MSWKGHGIKQLQQVLSGSYNIQCVIEVVYNEELIHVHNEELICSMDGTCNVHE
jgi:hypothetical protein